VSRVDVAVAVAEEARERLYEVAADCRALGLRHTATLAAVGVLIGSMESGDLPRLWAVAGVLAVEVKQDYQLSSTGRVAPRGWAH
jgi:hypothetical protein